MPAKPAQDPALLAELAEAQKEKEFMSQQLALLQQQLADSKTPAPQAPPPKASKQEHFSPSNLIDLPCLYLYDRSCWPDFKRALNECGLSWNLPDWLTTIVYQGEEWKRVIKTGHDLNSYFPTPDKKNAEDGNYAKSSALGTKLVSLLGLPKNLGESIQPTIQFCCLFTVKFEDERRLPARQKMWSWLVRSLKGTRPHKRSLSLSGG